MSLSFPCKNVSNWGLTTDVRGAEPLIFRNRLVLSVKHQRPWRYWLWPAGLIIIWMLICACPSALARDLAALPKLDPMPEPQNQGYVMISGARIWYGTYGKGEPLVLLHGGLANSDYWAGEIAVLAASHTVVVVDSRGHGRSSQDNEPLTYEKMADDVIAVLDHLNFQKASIAGWSDGGIIALVMGMRHPSRVKELIAIAANMDPSGILPDNPAKPRFKSYVKRARLEYKRNSPTPDQFGAFEAAVNQMWDTQPNYSAAALARIKSPTTIMIGEHDQAISREHSAYLAQAIPKGRLVVLPGLSHFSLVQDPEVVSNEILKALSLE